MRFHAISVVVVVAVMAALWGGSGIASAGGGCMHSTGPTTGRGDTVELQDMCFTSTVLYVEPGTDVTWINRDPMGHNVVGVGGTWGSLDLTLNQGDTVSYRFDEEGVFPYACWIHPGMIGAIVVGDGVGTGLAGVVPGSGSDAGSPASTEGAAAPVAQDGTVDTTFIWITGAALVLAGLGGGAFAIAARNRRKGVLAD